MAKKKAPNRYGFTPEIKTEALRLIRDESYTAKQAAEYAGCSVNAIHNWKAESKAGKIKVAAMGTSNGTETAETAGKSAKKTKKTKRRKRKGVTMTTVAKTATEKSSISFDEFVHGYWSEYKGASDILRLPADIMPKAVQYVNDVLRYAYNRFNGQ